ncbi:MAG: diguanylate cyclase [Solirubrobacteraceae bacterium]
MREAVGGIRRRWGLAAALLVAALVAAAGWYIAATQANSREAARANFERRAALTARLITGAFVASVSVEEVRERYGGPPAQVRRAVAQDGDTTSKRTIVLSAGGRVLAAAPRRLGGDRDLVSSSAHLRAALAGQVALSDAFHEPIRGWQIEIAVPFQAGSGRRVVASSGPVSIVDGFAAGFFETASALPGTRGYLLDGNGRVLSSTDHAGDGTSMDLRLAEALQQSSSGSYGDRTYVSAKAPSSQWRVALSVPTDALYATIEGPRVVAWALFGGFTIALAALLRIGVAAARGARRLAAARERERAAQQLAHERLHDALTGLPNRALFEDRAEHAIAAARRRGDAIAVVFMDLDNFKRINDSLGHARGDAVLQEIARRLRSSVRTSDTVSRFGGDEFIALLEARTHHQLLRLVDRMQHELQAPVSIDSRAVPVSFSIGVSIHSADDEPRTASALLQEADTAMYRAKASGRGRIEVFDADLQRQALERLDAEANLRRAIDHDELVVFYQPVVQLPDERIHGVEALVRWQRKDTGRLVEPSQFIPLAEETGLIGEIDERVLRSAIRDVGDWARRAIVADSYSGPWPIPSGQNSWRSCARAPRAQASSLRPSSSRSGSSATTSASSLRRGWSSWSARSPSVGRCSTSTSRAMTAPSASRSSSIRKAPRPCSATCMPASQRLSGSRMSSAATSP